MKIKKIEFCNINSLAGEWTVDFEAPDFASSGMFCISGPTGSGKTSILDAICLGLYGKTPRLGPIKGDSNEVMTYGTKTCYAKVTFESRDGVFSARWEQHRAPRTNKLQKYLWMLINETTGTVETSFSNQAEIEKLMTRVIGLDFGQFTKSMMLAQGEFNKFLKCNENERAAILEKLTGDGIYRKIAVAVHDLYEQADDAVKDVENKMGSVTLLSEEALAALNSNIADAERQKKTLTDEVERLIFICTWFDNFHSIEMRLQDAQKKLEDAEREKVAFEPNREKLEGALRAQEAESSFAEFNSVRVSLGRMKDELDENEKKLPTATLDLEQASLKNGEMQAAFEKCKADYSSNETVWERVSSMDGDIRNARKQLQMAVAEVAKIVAETETTQQKISETDRLIVVNESELEKVAKYIAENQKDETIDGQLSLLKTLVAEWKKGNTSCDADSKNLETLKKSLQEFDATFEKQNQELRSLQEYLEAHKADADLVHVLPDVNGLASEANAHHREVLRLQGEIATKNKQVENIRQEAESAKVRLSSLQGEKEAIIDEDIPVVVAELRRSLKPGEACPVCGSLDHKSCEEKENIENGANSLNDFANKLRKVNGEIEKVQRLLDGFASQMQNAEELLRGFMEKVGEETGAESQLLEQLNAKLDPWNKSVTLDSMQTVLQELLSLKADYLQKKERVDALLDEVHQATIKRTALAGEVNVASDLLDKSRSKLQEYSEKIEKIFAEWFSNVRMEDADAHLAVLDKKNSWWKMAQDKKVRVENELDKERSAKSQYQEALDLARSRLDAARANQDGLQESLNALEKSRKELFGEKSVDDERNKARLQREAAERQANEALHNEQRMREVKVALDKSIADLKNRIVETEPRLADLEKRFHENLASKGFADEPEFMAARLPESERKSLQQAQLLVDNGLMTARTSLKNFNDQLMDHQKKRDFEESEDVAKQNRDSAKSKLNECTVNLATWTEQKKNDEKQRQTFSDMQAELGMLKEKRSDWEQMQRWFNGNRLDTGNGDLFVKFIQTITLRNLLKIANGFLRDMFPRYEMVTEPNTLNIQLVDHDNSDAVRPIDNISGGEGFLVSLSLALGISTLASRNVSIDSMFLDEGFGTLDSKILQETVVVLQKMQQEKGKLLGVITHVDLVKSELATHIDVTPRGGRSVLSGAGVRNG